MFAAFLADVDRDAEPCRPRLLDHRRDLAVVVAAAAGARAGDVDADDSARRPADRLLDDDRVQLGAERPVHHQDQSRAHLRVLEARAVEPADRGEDDVVEVALAAPVSLHRVEAELERCDPLRAVRAADGRMHRALDGGRARLDQLRPVVDLVERVEVRDAARVGDGDEAVELPVVLHRQRDALLVREAPEDVGGNRAAEVRMQLGEPFHGGSLRGAARVSARVVRPRRRAARQSDRNRMRRRMGGAQLDWIGRSLLLIACLGIAAPASAANGPRFKPRPGLTQAQAVRKLEQRFNRTPGFSNAHCRLLNGNARIGWRHTSCIATVVYQGMRYGLKDHLHAGLLFSPAHGRRRGGSQETSRNRPVEARHLRLCAVGTTAGILFRRRAFDTFSSTAENRSAHSAKGGPCVLEPEGELRRDVLV